MGVLSVVVADDEELALNRLKGLLADLDVDVVGEATDGVQASALLSEAEVDAAFLAIEMPGLDGLEVARRLSATRGLHVVFVTAHHEHAVEAFRVQAVDYLVKPFDRQRLRHTVERLQSLRAGEDADLAALDTEAQAEETGLSSVAPWRRYAEHLLLKEDGELQFLSVQAIEWIEADGNYVRVYAAGREHLVRRRIGDLERQLDPLRFLRIHRSGIVNINAVSRLVPWFSGGYIVHLRCGKELKLSRIYANRLLAQVGTEF